MTTFHTVFDAGLEGYSAWPAPAIGLIFIAVGAVLVFKPHWAARLWLRMPRGKIGIVVRWYFFLFGLVWTIGTFVVTYRQYWTASEALKNGADSVIEGLVTQFEPMPRSGHGHESFVVEGRRFSYSDNIDGGFNRTTLSGGPIHEGLYVRIAYLDNLILRLEIGQ